MIADHCVAYYKGTATWKGDQGGGLCKAGATDAGVGTGQEAEFAKVPKTVAFEFCFKSPTSYLNCDNQEIQGSPLNSEPHPRGVAFKANTYMVGEVTFHTDHPFWESTFHDTPAHFDQFAAQALVKDGGAATVRLESAKGVDYTGFKDAAGRWNIRMP
jgi:hypothetical protein